MSPQLSRLRRVAYVAFFSVIVGFFVITGVRGCRISHSQKRGTFLVRLGYIRRCRHGQIIPTLAVDQYAATLARWFGVNASGIADVFPNLERFGSTNLGFLSA
jgi:hypothetical protein